jgi:hypothetical protein
MFCVFARICYKKNIIVIEEKKRGVIVVLFFSPKASQSALISLEIAGLNG